MSRKRHVIDTTNTQNIVPEVKLKSCCHNCVDFKSYIEDLFRKQTGKKNINFLVIPKINK